MKSSVEKEKALLMKVNDAIRGRRSIRVFRKVPLKDEDIKRILDAARWAPTACNKQLFEIIIIDDPKLRRAVAQLSNKCYYFHDAPLCLLVLYDKSKELVKEGVAPNIPALAAGAIIQNMLLEAHSLGIGSLVVGAITRKKQLKGLLQIPTFYEPMAFVLFGYPNEKPLPPPRRDICDFVHLNFFGNMPDGMRKTQYLFPNYLDPKHWTWDEWIKFKKRITFFAGRFSWCEPVNVVNPSIASILDIIAMRLKNEKVESLLDVFPGKGLLLRALSWRLPTSTKIKAVDYSDETSIILERELSFDGVSVNVKAVKLEGKELIFPFKNEVFDAITCLFRLENVPDTQYLLKESFRVLKENGLMFVALVNKWGPLNLYMQLKTLSKPRDFNKRWHWSIGPYSPISMNRLISEAEVAGFWRANEYHFTGSINFLLQKIKNMPFLARLLQPLVKKASAGTLAYAPLLRSTSDFLLIELIKP